MGNKSDPVITKCKEGENWTKVTFKPDLAKFNMTHLEDDVVALMKKRVVDLAGCLGKTVKVELNGQRLPIKSFQDYVGLYLQTASKSKPEPLPRYVPIIPLVLVNGSEGIGTGWSSFVPNYNPRDIVANVKRMLNEEPMQPMEPWYKGFKGTIEQSATKDNGVSYTITGIIEEIDETTLRITELPIRKWTQDYKEFLEALMNGNEKIKDSFIRDYKEYNTDTRVHFEVSLSEENMKIALQEGLLKKFKLTTTISTSNMHLFDPKGIIQKYETPEKILEAAFHIRLEFYVKRKVCLVGF